MSIWCDKQGTLVAVESFGPGLLWFRSSGKEAFGNWRAVKKARRVEACWCMFVGTRGQSIYRGDPVYECKNHF